MYYILSLYILIYQYNEYESFLYLLSWYQSWVKHRIIRYKSVRHATMNEELERFEGLAMKNKDKNHSKTSKDAIKSTLKCAYCNKSGHTKDHFFELMRYPEWWNHNEKGIQAKP